jgi:hypothetical protein
MAGIGMMFSNDEGELDGPSFAASRRMLACSYVLNVNYVAWDYVGARNPISREAVRWGGGLR